MKLKTKIISLLLCLIMICTCICGCTNSNTPNNGAIDPNGEILTEDILKETILKEDILTEDKLVEFTDRVKYIVEERLPEDVILEDIRVEMYLADDIEGVLDEYANWDAHLYDINWPWVFGQYAIGTAIIVVTGVIAYFTAEVPGVGYVFASSCKGALKEAVIGAIVGSALSTAAEALKSGKNPDALTKAAIEGSASGFMWGAITGALVGAFSGYKTYTNKANVFDGNKFLGTINQNGEVVNSNKVVAYVTDSRYIVDTTGKVLGMVDDAGNLVSNVISKIPSTGQILNATTKSVKYTISAGKVIDRTGKVVGVINEAGQIIDDAGHLIGLVDDAGRLVPGVTKTINAGYTLSLSGKIINKTIEVGGVTQYVDDAGRVIGTLLKTTNSQGQPVNYLLKSVDPKSVKYFGELPADGLKKVVGQLDDAGSLVSNWTKYFSAQRSTGVKLAWQQEKALVEATGRGTRDWTAAEIAELLTKGKVTGYQGHHINSALYSPQLAADPNNIIFYSAAEHLSVGHHGNYQNVTFGSLLSRAA